MSTNPQQFTSDEIQRRYKAWAKAYPNDRESLWYRYCDARDGLPEGETAEREAMRNPPDQMNLFALSRHPA